MQIQSAKFQQSSQLRGKEAYNRPAESSSPETPKDSFTFSDENWERKIGLAFYTPIGAAIGAIGGAFVNGGMGSLAGAAIGGATGAIFGWSAVGV